VRQIGQPVPILTTLWTKVPQKRASTHGTSATPSRCPIRHTSQQLSAAAAGVAADVEVVVPVAAAGNAVVDGRSSASSSPLEDSSGQSVSLRADAVIHGA